MSITEVVVTKFFNHSKWNGLTVADLVFPWFIWIMGISIVFSYKSQRKDSWLKRIYRVFRRTIILFAIGLFLNVNGTYCDTCTIPYSPKYWRELNLAVGP